ncbi:MAG TPA: alpha/beta hydrolase, partial [Candidatus Limnocylindria bacterium]|nr:alpha/beta hydrolase [Candidatus Limnocylindria bacterium]
ISSFEALDLLLGTAANRAIFPNLTDVVIVGHSAGGQFADRYAASTGEQAALAAAGVRVRYVVANPSSYLYFDATRWHATAGTFTALSSTERQACSAYDTYKYGITGLNAYTGSVGGATLRAQYGARSLTYLLGSLDTDPYDTSLDTSCPAKWQGAVRLERGLTHYSYLGTIYGQGVYANHLLMTVSGVGHDAKGIYTSPDGRAALFGSPG